MQILIAGQMQQVKIYTDGACKKNPGAGGYAAILVHKEGRREISGGFRRTTNNRMEMMAAIAALEALKAPCEVALFSDSRYLVDAINKKWYVKWRANGWLTSTREPVKNEDLWRRLIALLDVHRIIFLWVRGHAGHVENERCDAMAVAACKGGQTLPVDAGFEAVEMAAKSGSLGI